VTALIAGVLGFALAALAALYLPAWSSLGAGAALVTVLLLGGEARLPYAILAAGAAAAAGWAWRRHEQRAASRRLPEPPQVATVARPKKAKQAQREPPRRRAA
jgi:hypothetical protein